MCGFLLFVVVDIVHRRRFGTAAPHRRARSGVLTGVCDSNEGRKKGMRKDETDNKDPNLSQMSLLGV